MTIQEAYEQIRAHFSKPGAVLAMDANLGVCAYRVSGDPNTSDRCAFGVLIPNELYSSGMEETCASEVLQNYPALAERLEADAEFTEFVEAAQSRHDQVADVDSFLISLDELAATNGLKVVE